jgi:phage baseplate assembly protein W
MPDLELDRQHLRRRLLGWSALCEPIFPGLDHGRDLALVSTPNGVDLAIVEGMDNLAQAVQMSLTTARGTDIFNTAFGFDGLNAMADERDPIMARERIRVSVVDVLRRDRRVRRVVEIGAPVPFEPADPIERWRTFQINATFESITAEPLSFTANV